jgi:hypothetical protein
MEHVLILLANWLVAIDIPARYGNHAKPIQKCTRRKYTLILRYNFPIASSLKGIFLLQNMFLRMFVSCPLRVDVDEFVTFQAQGIKECALDATYTVGKCKTASTWVPSHSPADVTYAMADSWTNFSFSYQGAHKVVSSFALAGLEETAVSSSSCIPATVPVSSKKGGQTSMISIHSSIRDH